MIFFALAVALAVGFGLGRIKNKKAFEAQVAAEVAAIKSKL